MPAKSGKDKWKQWEWASQGIWGLSPYSRRKLAHGCPAVEPEGPGPRGTSCRAWLRRSEGVWMWPLKMVVYTLFSHTLGLKELRFETSKWKPKWQPFLSSHSATSQNSQQDSHPVRGTALCRDDGSPTSRLQAQLRASSRASSEPLPIMATERHCPDQF